MVVNMSIEDPWK